MIQRSYTAKLEQSVIDFPSLKTTFNLAKKAGIEITGHIVNFNRRGTVNYHAIAIRNHNGQIEWWRNQVLLGFLKTRINYNVNKIKPAPKQNMPEA